MTEQSGSLDQWRAEKLRLWLQGFTKELPERLGTALKAVDAFEGCADRSVLAEDDLGPLVDAARSPHKVVFETGCHLLERLARTHPAAQRCIQGMAEARDCTSRFHAVAYLGEELPEALRLRVIELALADRSARVRAMGVQRAEGFGFTSLLCKLEDMRKTERDEGVVRALNLHIPLLRDGYRIEPSRAGSGYELTVRCPGSLCGVLIPSEKFSPEFVRQEVDRLRRARAR